MVEQVFAETHGRFGAIDAAVHESAVQLEEGGLSRSAGVLGIVEFYFTHFNLLGSLHYPVEQRGQASGRDEPRNDEGPEKRSHLFIGNRLESVCQIPLGRQQGNYERTEQAQRELNTFFRSRPVEQRSQARECCQSQKIGERTRPAG